MKRTISFLLLLLAVVLQGDELPKPTDVTADALPALSDDRVVIETTEGDIVIAVYASAAPDITTHFLQLVHQGVYDHTPFTFVDPGYYLQVGTTNDRRDELTNEQILAARRVNSDFSLPHKKGAVSLTLVDNVPNSGESAFTILRADAPHLDGQGSVFGEVVDGEATLARLESVPRNRELRPEKRIEIVKMQVMTQAEAAAHKLLVEDSRSQTSQLKFSIGSFIAILLVSLAGFFLKNRVAPLTLRSLNLVNALLAAFAILVLFTPLTKTVPLLGGGIFVGMVALFKLMNRFESTN